VIDDGAEKDTLTKQRSRLQQYLNIQTSKHTGIISTNLKHTEIT